MDGGGGFDGDVGEKEDEEVLLPPLKSVFECAYVNLMPSGCHQVPLTIRSIVRTLFVPTVICKEAVTRKEA